MLYLFLPGKIPAGPDENRRHGYANWINKNRINFILKIETDWIANYKTFIFSFQNYIPMLNDNTCYLNTDLNIYTHDYTKFFVL